MLVLSLSINKSPKTNTATVRGEVLTKYLLVLNKTIINIYSKSWILFLKICFKIILEHYNS